MSELDDAVLVRRVLAGESDLYGVLVDRYRREFGRYATSMMGGDRDTAADVMQEAFIRAYDALASCRDPRSFKAWLFRILTNRCHNALRRERRLVGVDRLENTGSNAGGPDDCLEQSELATAIQRALDTLTPEQREAFVLKHVDGRSYAEMSELLHVGEDALKMRVHRARDELRRRLGDLS